MANWIDDSDDDDDYPEYRLFWQGRDDLEYETAIRIIDKTKEILAEYDDVSKEFGEVLAKDILGRLFTVEAILEPLNGGENPEDPSELSLERLQAEVEVISFHLDARIHVTGDSHYLALGDVRYDFYDRLRVLYSTIKKLDPSFEVPVLPERPAAKPNTSTSANASNSSGGCYVATAVYGSYDCPQVWTLRRYRDNTLAASWYGRLFVRTYYAISPTLVKWFGTTGWFRSLWKPSLDKMVDRLQKAGVAGTPYEDRNW